MSQLALIEAAFEGDESMPVASGLARQPVGIGKATLKFGRTIWNYETCEHESPVPAEARVTKIMRNIIRNNGTFVP